MAGPKLELFKAVETAIKAIVDSDGNTVVKEFGLWNNQFDHEREETSFNFPAVFLEFASLPWELSKINPIKSGELGNIVKEQKGGPGVIVIHCGFSYMRDNEQAFEDLEPKLELIYFAIQGLQGELFNPLQRIDERQDVEHNRVQDWQMDFSSILTQCGEEDSSLIKIDADTLTLELSPIDLDIELDTTGDIRTGPEK